MRFQIITQSYSLFFILFIGCSIATHGQSNTNRSDLEQRIQLTNQLLKDVRQDRNASSQTLKTLKHQIADRKSLIVSIQDEMGSIDQEILTAGNQIEILKNEVSSIREEYFEILRMQQRQELITNQKWLYLFSAKSLKDLILRYTYSKRFERYAQEKMDVLRTKLQRIEKRTQAQLTDRQDKQKLMNDIAGQQDAMDEDLKQQAILLEQLKRSENNLLAELRENEKEKKRLDHLIKEVMVTKPTPKLNPSTEVHLTDSFAKNKGALPWPVNNGFVVNRFGERNHEVLKNVKVYNNGIDIRTTAGSQVLSVFDGVVMEVVQISEEGKMVLIRHNRFLSAYLNLSDVSVSKGDQVSIGTVLGTLKVVDGVSDLQFQIWQESKKLNPTNWLQKK